MYKLVIADDEGKTTVVPLFDDVVTIGRKDSNTVCLPERNISRYHAKLTRADGQLRIEDFSSYTGVIVNGRRIQGRAVLNPGDRLTIGDYRMALEMEPDLHVSNLKTAAERRTVPDTPVGGVLPEPFRVAPDVKPRLSKLQDDRSTSPEVILPVSRLPLVVAIGIIGTATMFAGLMIYNAMAARERTARQDTADLELMRSGQEFWGFLRDCQQALQGQRYHRAMELGKQALALRPESEQAQGCHAAASRAFGEQQAFDQGRAMFEQDRIEEAYEHFQRALTDTSAFRSRSEVIQTARLYAALRLDQAEQVSRTDPEAARGLLQEILGMHLAPAQVRRKAESLHSSLVEKNAPRPHPMAQRPKSTEAVGAAVATAPAPVVVAPAASYGVAPVAGGLAAAKECLQRGDNPCAIAALRRATTPAELALRIATHRQMGNTQAAVRDMQTYIGRYPADIRSVEYREFLRLRPGGESTVP